MRTEDPTPARGTSAVLASAVGYGLDGFDLLVLSFALSGIIAEFHLSTTRAGSLTTLTLLGAVVGGVTFGLLGDRFGRVRTMTWSVVLFGVFTGLSALAQGFADLAAYRFLAGVGIGGEFGVGMTLAAESVPAHWRARATSMVGVGFQAGVLAAALVAAPVLAVWGWRGLFAVGVLPAVVALLLRNRLPESPVYLASRESLAAPDPHTAADPAAAGPRPTSALGTLVATPAAVRITAAMVVLTSVQNFGYFGIMTWLPTYLSGQLHLGVTKGSLWTAVTVVGMAVGIVLFGQFADRVGRRPAFWTFQLGAAAAVLVYSRLTDPTALLVGGFVMGAFANGMLGGYGALLAELYPTRARATAQNVLFNVGRGVGGLAPVVMATLAGAHGFGFALSLLPVIYLLAFAATFAVPERRGVRLP